MLLITRTFLVSKSASYERNVLDVAYSAPLAESGPNPEQVMVVFKETAWENSAFGGG